MEIVVVSGFGRCGSSLVMKMLDKGGMPIYADHPQSYETDRNLKLPKDHAWLEDCQGKAVKLLDPHVYQPPMGYQYRVIWLDRLPIEQAKSQAKLIRLLRGYTPTKHDIKVIAQSLRDDRHKAFDFWEIRKAIIWHTDFEMLIFQPRLVAELIANFLNRNLNLEAMANCVVERSPQCLPHLLEEQLIEPTTR